MADNCTTCDVAIVGSGFAGSLIANELAKKGIKVIILEAGQGVQPNSNEYMRRFYAASAKIPESPYPPALDDSDQETDPEKIKLIDPAKVAAGRPTVRTLSASTWKDPLQAYLDQKGKLPFKSTYERLAGGTSHWLGLTPRLVPNDFRMAEVYGHGQADFLFPDWPIDYETVRPYYEKAEAELGVSADVGEQQFSGISFSEGYAYPMRRIPPSRFDQRVRDVLETQEKLTVGQALEKTDPDTKFREMWTSATPLKVRSLPAARNSQPYRNRRACAGNTSCIPICPIQAKYDPTITLNEAMNNGARLIDTAVASEIRLENDRVSGINFIRYDPKTGLKIGEGCLAATVYVIAANGIETPRLLLMSRNQRPNGVANSSDMVGRHLMDHPQYLTWGLLPAARPVFPYRGPLVTSAIGDLCDGPFRAERAAFRISLGNEGWNVVVGGNAQFGADPHVTTLDFVNGMNSSGLNRKEFSQLNVDNGALFGGDLARTLSNLIPRQFRIAFAIEQNPDPNNRVELSSSLTDGLHLPRPKITYDISDYTRKGIIAAVRMKRLIFGKLQAQDFTERGASEPVKPEFDVTIDNINEKLTFGGAGHIMGTYRMGVDPRTSVVDSWQRSHDHPNLYLVGSGTFPTVGTANPTLTLSALALRTVEDIVRKLPYLYLDKPS